MCCICPTSLFKFMRVLNLVANGRKLAGFGYLWKRPLLESDFKLIGVVIEIFVIKYIRLWKKKDKNKNKNYALYYLLVFLLNIRYSSLYPFWRCYNKSQLH